MAGFHHRSSHQHLQRRYRSGFSPGYLVQHLRFIAGNATQWVIKLSGLLYTGNRRMSRPINYCLPGRPGSRFVTNTGNHLTHPDYARPWVRQIIVYGTTTTADRRGGSLTLPLILQSKISSPKAKNDYFPGGNSKLLRNLGGRVRDPPLRGCGKVSSPRAKIGYFPGGNSKLLRKLGGRVRDPPLRGCGPFRNINYNLPYKRNFPLDSDLTLWFILQSGNRNPICRSRGSIRRFPKRREHP